MKKIHVKIVLDVEVIADEKRVANPLHYAIEDFVAHFSDLIGSCGPVNEITSVRINDVRLMEYETTSTKPID